MKQQSKNVLLVLIFLIVFLFAWLFHFLGYFQIAERFFLDLKLSLNNTRVLDDKVVRIYVDDTLFYNNEIQPNKEKIKNLSREKLANFIKFIETANPKLLIIKLNLLDYEDNSLSSNSPDILLSNELKEHNNIILTTDFNKKADFYKDISDNFLPTQTSLNVKIDNKELDKNITYYSYSQVSDIFTSTGFMSVGNILLDLNKVRYSRPIYKIVEQGKEYYLPSVAFAAFLKYHNLQDKEITIKKNILSVGEFNFPLNKYGDILINLNIKNQYYQSFPISIFLNAINKNEDSFIFENKTYNIDYLKDKIIFFENTPNILYELPNGEKLTSAEVDATIMQGYLQDTNLTNPSKIKFIYKPSLIWNILIIVIFCGLITISNLKFKNKVLAFLLILLFILINIVLFIHPKTRIWLLTAIPLYFMSLTFIITFIWTIFMKFEIKEKIINILKNHVSKVVLKKILKKYNNISLTPTNKDISILVCNIKDFVQISDMLVGEFLLKRLDEIFDIVIKTAFSYNGTITRNSNHSILIYWGTPLSENKNKDALNAILCAVEIQQKLKQLNNLYLNNNQINLELKMGIHFGEVLAGYMGPDKFKEYTILGNTIDSVLKIEKIGEELNKDIMISETLYNLLQGGKNAILGNNNIFFSSCGSIPSPLNKQKRINLFFVDYDNKLREENDKY